MWEEYKGDWTLTYQGHVLAMVFRTSEFSDRNLRCRIFFGHPKGSWQEIPTTKGVEAARRICIEEITKKAQKMLTALQSFLQRS